MRLATILAMLGALLAWLSATTFQPESSATAAPAGTTRLQYVGAGSCASAACHSQPVPQGTTGCEYTTWASRDRHARAYTVLLEDRSKQIEKNLKRLPSLADAKPEENQFCLKCHALPLPPEQQGRTALLLDGVSCERCHGPAQHWLARHYLPDWQRTSATEKQRLGMYPTKDLVFRAELCASCHVGTTDADPIHDLLGAGHPRINHYEFSNHLAQMPPHWNERRERARQPGIEARAWAIGQVVSARAALELLEKRARDRTSPWPEFAEYECAACHHDLREPSIREQPGPGKPQLSALSWNTWFEPALPYALDGDLPPEFAEIRRLMAERYPDRDRVAPLARAAADRLREALPRVASARYDEPDQLARRLAAVADGPPPTGWDGAAQRYLALTALYRTLGELAPQRRQPSILASLRTLHGMLEPPPGRDVRNPHRLSLERFREEQQKIRDQLGR
ncbi:MAG: hypothetical protein JNM56_30780 [Planctomycetia bacterium]|nr:hypothetical protein [Planctomycetia bacterium]